MWFQKIPEGSRYMVSLSTECLLENFSFGLNSTLGRFVLPYLEINEPFFLLNFNYFIKTLQVKEYLNVAL